MYCTFCGTRNPEDSVLCQNRGRSILLSGQPSGTAAPIGQETLQPGSMPVQTGKQKPSIPYQQQPVAANQGTLSSGTPAKGRISRRAVITSLVGGIAVVIGGGATLVVIPKLAPSKKQHLPLLHRFVLSPNRSLHVSWASRGGALCGMVAR